MTTATGVSEDGADEDRNNSRAAREKKGEKPKKNQKNIFTTILVNARSLLPKLDSLNDVLCELDVDLALITETWLTEVHEIERLL